MDAIHVDVYRAADGHDYTNDGVTSRHERVMMFYNCTREEAAKCCEAYGVNEDACIVLVKRILWGEKHYYVRPLVHRSDKTGPMFGGNFVYSSDSRFAEAIDARCSSPIPVHDRYETTEEYASYD